MPSAGFGRTGLGPSFGSGFGHQGALSALSSFDKLSQTLSHLKLTELPKTGSGIRVRNDENLAKVTSPKPVKRVDTTPSSSPKTRHDGLVGQNSKIIKPKVPFVVNGKPHSPHVLNKQKWRRHKKKKKKDRISTKPNEISTTETKFSTKVKPHKVNKPIEIVPDASARVTEQRSKNKTNSRLAGTSKNSEMSVSGQNSGNSPPAHTHKKSKVKSRPTNSPIYTYQLPPNLSFNSLRSLLGSIKGGGDPAQPKVKTKSTTTKKTTTTTTTTTTATVTTTTTSTTTTTTEDPSVNEINVSQVFTYKLPPFFSASAFKKFLIGYGHAKHSGDKNKNPFSLQKYIRGKSSAKRSTTTAPTTTTTTRRTTTTTTTASPALSRSPSSPITWIAGKLTGIPSRIFNFKVPFALLSWIDSLGSSHHKSEPIKLSSIHY